MLLDCINLKYRNSIENNLNELDIEVLTYLENMGYSMDIRGTLYFKDMIVSIIENILSFSSLYGKEMKELLENIRNPYSQFYLDLARNKNDLGINTFNQFIRQAIELNEEELTGLRAYQVALEILRNRGIDINIEPIIRKLDK